MLLKVEVAFVLKDIVYHKMAKEKEAGMITAIIVKDEDTIFYWVTWPDMSEREHQACELTKTYEKNDYGTAD